MAYADYRLCDVCKGKAFYDSGLGYDFDDSTGRAPYLIAGEPQPCGDSVRLGYLGDWAVLCVDCAETHRTMIVKRENSDG